MGIQCWYLKMQLPLLELQIMLFSIHLQIPKRNFHKQLRELVYFLKLLLLARLLARGLTTKLSRVLTRSMSYGFAVE